MREMVFYAFYVDRVWQCRYGSCVMHTLPRIQRWGCLELVTGELAPTHLETSEQPATA